MPDNPIARSLLANAVHLATFEKPWASGGTSEFAKDVSGKVYSLYDNKLRLKTFTLKFYDSDLSWVTTTYTDKGMAGLPDWSGSRESFVEVSQHLLESMQQGATGPATIRL